MQTPPQIPSEKKISKKELAKLERQRKRRQEAAAASTLSAVNIDDSPLTCNYGEIPFKDLQSKEISGRIWTEVIDLTTELKDQSVLIRGRAQTIRAMGKRMAFVVVRSLRSDAHVVSPRMIKFATSLSPESTVDIEGVVSVPAQSITGTTQQSGQLLARVHQDTRLNFRFIDTRTSANLGIFRIEFEVEEIFREFLKSEGFVGIRTPKLLAGSSEGGSAVFRLDYKGKLACLAQSPQLHKQMAVSGGFGRVFVMAPVFRAEDSFTHRHLCEFTVIFDYLNEKCSKELEDVRRQYPFENLKEAGVEIDPLGDLNTESERKLGQPLVLEKYNTEFYILHRYPLAVRPFYTMPCYDDPNYSNSFDVFIRGAQRIHMSEYLAEHAQECGIDVKTLSTYINSFRYGSFPHGGFGIGLECVAMLFMAINNIRKCSLFRRDPQRLDP
ncbi:hypothetical protein BUALT_Bualt05G0031200 [Buddleja alternifolia]|uniref:aspartate--tRNA ligase n=1 Tax=Buddleja alternifolia TaxID=168488 RepID=A0AAV6XN17_9LAMI|nr:hypothetical protein BUALT_Bualt05G0031200 [Buddleja alternifolia]